MWNVILLYIDQFRIGFMKVFAGIELIIDLWKAASLLKIQLFVNSAIKIINGFISLLNKLPGVAIETVQEVTIGTDALKKASSNAQQNLDDIEAAEVLAAARIEERELKAIDTLNQVNINQANGTDNENAFTKMLDGFGDQLNKIIGGKTLEIGLEGKGENGSETSLDTLLNGLDSMKANAAQKKLPTTRAKWRPRLTIWKLT
jgi:hypothetical protein